MNLTSTLLLFYLSSTFLPIFSAHFWHTNFSLYVIKFLEFPQKIQFGSYFFNTIELPSTNRRKQKIYLCEYNNCGKSYRSKENLNLHIQNVHQNAFQLFESANHSREGPVTLSASELRKVRLRFHVHQSKVLHVQVQQQNYSPHDVR